MEVQFQPVPRQIWWLTPSSLFLLLLFNAGCASGAVPTITSPASATATAGVPFSYQITARNSPTSYGAAGLPKGLSVNTGTGLISGTPGASGTFVVIVSATNATATAKTSLTLAIKPSSGAAAPAITSSTTAGGTVGSSFSYQITATNDPTSYAASGLPSGLTVNSLSGLISGKPTGAGTSKVMLSATNAEGTGGATLTLTVSTTNQSQVSLLPGTVTFNSQAVGTRSAAQTITLASSGSAGFGLSSVAITGSNACDFAQTNDCGSSLAAGANCTINVTFTPTLDGMRSGALTVSDAAAGSPQTVSLTGTGVGQFMTLSPDATYLRNTITGKPVFITGDTAQNLSVQLCSDADVDTYLSDRAAKKINLIWVFLADAIPQHDGNGGEQNDCLGNSPWDGGWAFTGT